MVFKANQLKVSLQSRRQIALEEGSTLSIRRWLVKQCRVVGYVFSPKLVHHRVHVLRAKAAPVGTFTAELTRPFDSRKGVARMWREACVSRLVNDAVRRDIELITPD